MPIPVDSDSREVYRQLLRSPILRDMVSTTRMYPGARAMVVKIDQGPSRKSISREVQMCTLFP